MAFGVLMQDQRPTQQPTGYLTHESGIVAKEQPAHLRAVAVVALSAKSIQADFRQRCHCIYASQCGRTSFFQRELMSTR